jgi:hypothetical protein
MLQKLFLVAVLALAALVSTEVSGAEFSGNYDTTTSLCCLVGLVLSKVYTHLSRLFLLVFHVQAFTLRPVLPATTLSTSTTSLFASRTNAKKLKIKRNRENMRKFATPGRRGLSRRKLLKKAQASKARQEENEFIAKCFITGPAPNSDDE